MNSNAGARIICGLIKLSHEDPITTTSESTTSSIPSPTTVNGSSTTHIPTPSVTTAATTKSAGLNIQPAMFILIITAITGYIIHY